MAVGLISERRYLRVPMLVGITIEGRPAPHAYAINISETGMCIQSPQQFAAGLKLDVSVVLSLAEAPLSLTGEVIWCTGEHDRVPGMTYFELGFQFCSMPPASEGALERFLDRDCRFCEAGYALSASGWSG